MATGATGGTPSLTVSARPSKQFLITAEAHVTATGTTTVTCLLSADSNQVAQRTATPQTSGGPVEMILAGAGTTQSGGFINLSCFGQASVQQLYIQALQSNP